MRKPIAKPPAIPPGDRFVLGPDSCRQPGVPRGRLTRHRWRSRIFPGTWRDYWIYIPAQYRKSRPACVMVFQDGEGYLNASKDVRAPIVFDNLIHKVEMPVTLGLFINPGYFPPVAKGEAPISNRTFEYDSLGDRYARFLLEEILPDVGRRYRLVQEPEGRAICGASSGGICAWTVAWERPDAFRKVISHVGSFVNYLGGHLYPFMIRQAERKPIRVFLQAGLNDINNTIASWSLANQEMAAALEFRRYDVKFVLGSGSHSCRHGGALFPDSMRWLWRP